MRLLGFRGRLAGEELAEETGDGMLFAVPMLRGSLRFEAQRVSRLSFLLGDGGVDPPVQVTTVQTVDGDGAISSDVAGVLILMPAILSGLRFPTRSSPWECRDQAQESSLLLLGVTGLAATGSRDRCLAGMRGASTFCAPLDAEALS